MNTNLGDHVPVRRPLFVPPSGILVSCAAPSLMGSGVASALAFFAAGAAAAAFFALRLGGMFCCSSACCVGL